LGSGDDVTFGRILSWIGLLVTTSCAATGPGAVTAPSAVSGAGQGPTHAASPAPRDDLDACAQEWTLDRAGSDPGSVIVVCGSDVRRELLSRSPALRGAIAPALEPARQRVCACAARQPPPAFVDLVVTATPGRGRATVEGSLSAEADDDVDPALGAPFVACIGTVVATFPPLPPAGVCDGALEGTLKYPLRVELTR
jgi:hypothetical protein